jgi:hypothetical protein
MHANDMLRFNRLVNAAAPVTAGATGDCSRSSWSGATGGKGIYSGPIQKDDPFVSILSF